MRGDGGGQAALPTFGKPYILANMHRTGMTCALASLAFASMAAAALKPIDADLKPSNDRSVAVFKSTPEGELKIHLYFPKDWKPADRRPAILFFFGGGFVGGTPAQFTTKAQYLAGRGLVA